MTKLAVRILLMMNMSLVTAAFADEDQAAIGVLRLGPEPTDSSTSCVTQIAYFSDARAQVDDAAPPDPSGYPTTAYPTAACAGVECTSPESCCCCSEPACSAHAYVDLQWTFFRTHMSETALPGKLSEDYELSPRLVLGYESASGTGGRFRYWSYHRTTQNLTFPADTFRPEMDILDLEGTHRFGNANASLVVGGGFRWAIMEIETLGGDETVKAAMPGATFAADLRTTICRTCNSEWASVCGARWSILGGDWRGDDNGFIRMVSDRNHDDNIVTSEFYGGVEYLRHWGHVDVYSRMVFEAQNWRSDAMSESTGADSIGFIGPGFDFGARF